MIDVLGGMQGLADLPFLGADPFADLQAGLKLRDFRRANAFHSGNFAGSCFIDAFEPAKLIKQQTRMIDGAFTRTRIAITENDCQELGFAERLSAYGKQFLAWAIRLGPVFDG